MAFLFESDDHAIRRSIYTGNTRPALACDLASGVDRGFLEDAGGRVRGALKILQLPR